LIGRFVTSFKAMRGGGPVAVAGAGAAYVRWVPAKYATPATRASSDTATVGHIQRPPLERRRRSE
jgi:hypothetical protein